MLLNNTRYTVCTITLYMYVCSIQGNILYVCSLLFIGHIDVVRTLLCAGAVIGTANNAGKTATQLGGLTGNGKYKCMLKLCCTLFTGTFHVILVKQ